MQLENIELTDIDPPQPHSPLKALIGEDYPCVMAQAMLKKDSIFETTVKSACPSKIAFSIKNSLLDFEKRFTSNETDLYSYIAYLPEWRDWSFERCEKAFWTLLGSIITEEKDIRLSEKGNLKDYIKDPNFSLTVNGVDYFLIFLHPESPRKARRLETPAIVFNRFEQFETLREKGVFEMVRDQIRQRDQEFSGSVNPMLSNHGESSEILQYTGKDYSKANGCPFSSILENMKQIPPRSGVAFELKKGELLTVIDPKGQQVSDLFCFNLQNDQEYYSSGRTIDYNSKIFLSKNDYLFSSHSQKMLKIVEDDVGRHDLLLTPCSSDTFEILYENEPYHRGCEGNLISAFADFGMELEALPSAFNIFMNVSVEPENGKIEVLPPKSKPGDKICFEAQMDLIVGLTACSAPMSNNGQCKSISFLKTNNKPGFRVNQ